MKTRTYLRIPAQVLYRVARLACREIERTGADLVIACHPAGQGMLHATRAVWEASHATPFPAVVMIAFGSEKLDACPPMQRQFGNVEDRGPVIFAAQAGYALACVAQQARWREELAAVVETQLGRAPRAAVVLSDFEWGSIGEPALALFDAVYPGVPAQAVVGPPVMDTWQLPFTFAWLYRHVRHIFSHEIGPQQDPEANEQVVNALAQVALGYDMVDPGSLLLSAITAGHPAVEAALAALSLETCLALPEGVRDEVRSSVLYLHRLYTRGRWSHRLAKADRWIPAGALTLDPLKRIGTALWLRRQLSVEDTAALSGLPREDVTVILEELLRDGVVIAEGTGDDRVYCLRSDTGVLAYGALLADPGAELAAVIEQRTPVQTPFPVEYVRSNLARAGAPELAPVPEGYGSPVPAEMWTLGPQVDRTLAETLLYRWALDVPGEQYVFYSSDAAAEDGVDIRSLDGFAGLPTVLYLAPAPNLPEVIPPDVPLAEKGDFLAQLALASVTTETAAARRDGIALLADALARGALTPLTPAYRDAVLQRTGAADLGAAREA